MESGANFDETQCFTWMLTSYWTRRVDSHFQRLIHWLFVFVPVKRWVVGSQVAIFDVAQWPLHVSRNACRSRCQVVAEQLGANGDRRADVHRFSKRSIQPAWRSRTVSKDRLPLAEKSRDSFLFDGVSKHQDWREEVILPPFFDHSSSLSCVSRDFYRV